MAICHRMELRVYDRTGTGSYTVLPASQIKGSMELGGGGFIAAQAESRAEPIASAPRLLDDCVIKVALPLSEPGTTLTEVMAYANRGRAGTLWAGPGEQVRQVRGGTLFTVWSQDAVLHPEGNTIAQMAASERYFGWMSTMYDPADDPGQWGTPSANAGQQDSTTGDRAGQPADWPTELGNAYWITRGTTANGTRHLFIADCVVPSACYLTVYYSADESIAVYFGGSLIGQTSSSETGYQTMGTWSAYVQAGTYRVGIDKTSVVSRGGDGRDPVLLAVATNTDTGAVDDILLVTNTTDWQIYTTDPVDGTVPSLTPGQIVQELAAQAAARGVDTWDGLTLDFDADLDTAGQPWPVREERAWRIAYDRHLDMIEGLGDLGFCPEIGPDLVLRAWGNRGTDRSATVTLATLDEVDRVDESGTGVAATYLPVETQDGWVIVENPVAAATYGRRESALSLGNAPSIAQGKRLGQKVLDDRLAKPETERTVQFYARAGSVPFVDFWVGDTVSLTVGASTTKGVVLDLGYEADHTEAIIRWTAKVTGDGISGETRSARFNTEPAQALAEGGTSSFELVTPGVFATVGGSAVADGGIGDFGIDDGSVVFYTNPGSATAAGGVGEMYETIFIPGTATGGDYEAIADGYHWHEFTADGSFVVSGTLLEDVDYLIVAGGGGGGAGGGSIGGGGGGGGGVIVQTAQDLTSGTYAVVIGDGGASATSGEDSTFNGETAVGGGAGGRSSVGTTGGSGGGGSGSNGGGAGTSGQGYAGGTGASVSTYRAGGGGGGAGGVGGNASSITAPGAGGGSYAWLDGFTFSGGGGGGAYNNVAGSNATPANRGHGGQGGGGSGSTGGAGSAGRVSIRYPALTASAVVRGFGAGNAGSSSVTPPLISGAQSTDLHIAFVANKDYTCTVSGGSPFTEDGTVVNGSTASSSMRGSVRVTALSATGTASDPTFTITGANTAIAAVASIYASNAVDFQDPVAYTMADGDTSGQGISGSVAAVDIRKGDTLLIATSLSTDWITQTSQVLTVPGCTLSAITWVQATTATGDDVQMYLGYCSVTAGRSTGGATYTASTDNTYSDSSIALVRVR